VEDSGNADQDTAGGAKEEEEEEEEDEEEAEEPEDMRRAKSDHSTPSGTLFQKWSVWILAQYSVVGSLGRKSGERWRSQGTMCARSTQSASSSASSLSSSSSSVASQLLEGRGELPGDALWLVLDFLNLHAMLKMPNLATGFFRHARQLRCAGALFCLVLPRAFLRLGVDPVVALSLADVDTDEKQILAASDDAPKPEHDPVPSLVALIMRNRDTIVSACRTGVACV